MFQRKRNRETSDKRTSQRRKWIPSFARRNRREESSHDGMDLSVLQLLNMYRVFYFAIMVYL